MLRDRSHISEITRRDITDLISAERIVWWGRGDEIAFLSPSL
jgi:hypothetical protein